jgi:Thiolase, N-terminal domain
VSSVWIAGAAMTAFGRHRDRDLIDLGAEAAMAAMRDAGLTIHDVGLLAVGNAYEASGMVAQRLLKQIGQTGIEAYNVFNACATGASAVRIAHLAIEAGQVDVALVVGVEQMGKMGMLGAANKARGDKRVFEPAGRFGAVIGTEGRSDARGVRPGRHRLRPAARCDIRAVRQGGGEEPRPLRAQPVGPVPHEVLARRDHVGGDDRLSQYGADVLPDR